MRIAIIAPNFMLRSLRPSNQSTTPERRFSFVHPIEWIDVHASRPGHARLQRHGVSEQIVDIDLTRYSPDERHTRLPWDANSSQRKAGANVFSLLRCTSFLGDARPPHAYALTLWFAERTIAGRWNSGELLQQRLRFDEIPRVETFGEPGVERSEQIRGRVFQMLSRLS